MNYGYSDLDNCQTFSQNWTKLSLLLQGKQLTEFFANDKTQVYTQKLEF